MYVSFVKIGLTNPEGWYIILNKGGEGAAALEEPYAGPYRREQDAKGQLTRLRKGYTPAARKV